MEKVRVGYSFNENNELVLARYRGDAYFNPNGFGVDCEVRYQTFDTDGTIISYTVKYEVTYTIASFFARELKQKTKGVFLCLEKYFTEKFKLLGFY